MENELNQFDVKVPEIKKLIAKKLVKVASGSQDNLQINIALNNQKTSASLKRFCENKTHELQTLRGLKSTFKQEHSSFK